MDKYDKEKYYSIMNTTQMNYANMLKRICFKRNFSNFILIEYSIFLIIYALTQKFYPAVFDVDLSSYFSIIISIVLLVYSLINNNANYSERITKIGLIINNVKNIKRELSDENIYDKKAEYDKIMINAEYRDDIDFFITLKQMCRANNIRWFIYKYDISKSKMEASKLNNYLSEINPYIQQLKISLNYFLCFILITLPLVIFTLCIIMHNVKIWMLLYNCTI